MVKKPAIQEKRGEAAYRIKNKRLGTIYVSFSEHGQTRMKERKVELLQFLTTLTQVSDELAGFDDGGETLLIDTKKDLSIILSVSKTDKAIYYFNVITVLSGIPVNEDGELRFYNISHFINV